MSLSLLTEQGLHHRMQKEEPGIGICFLQTFRLAQFRQFREARRLVRWHHNRQVAGEGTPRASCATNSERSTNGLALIL